MTIGRKCHGVILLKLIIESILIYMYSGLAVLKKMDNRMFPNIHNEIN